MLVDGQEHLGVLGCTGFVDTCSGVLVHDTSVLHHSPENLGEDLREDLREGGYIRRYSGSFRRAEPGAARSRKDCPDSLVHNLDQDIRHSFAVEEDTAAAVAAGSPAGHHKADSTTCRGAEGEGKERTRKYQAFF